MRIASFSSTAYFSLWGLALAGVSMMRNPNAVSSFVFRRSQDFNSNRTSCS